MSLKSPGVTLLITFGLLGLPLAANDAATAKVLPTRADSARSESGALWRDPGDIGSRDLFFGPGGEHHEPHGPFTFVEEDLSGSNPKYVVLDRDKVKWTVKLGVEARPETVASRLVWAVGYFTNEDYFLRDLQIENMPAHVKRGAELIEPGGFVQAARLKRHLEEQKKVGNWKWRDNPMTGTRELNGLKVMMALINNWDLKDENNEIYGGRSGEMEYVVSDLGASFGTTGYSLPLSRSKGNVASYVHSRFIRRISPEFVSFKTPSRPTLIDVFCLPDFVERIRMERLVRRIPRADAQWMGQLLSRLSPDQIRDAFRAAGYAPEQVEEFSQVVRARIAELAAL